MALPDLVIEAHIVNEVDHRCHVEGQWPERHVVIKAVTQALDVTEQGALGALSRLERADVLFTSNEQRLTIPHKVLDGPLGPYLRIGRASPTEDNHLYRIRRVLQEHEDSLRDPTPRFDDFAERMRKRRGEA